ncbi:hypothetical protein GCM10027403_12330 [Arthrobacter tecti]
MHSSHSGDHETRGGLEGHTRRLGHHRQSRWIKHVLGVWMQATEGAKFWAGVCAEVANRGVKNVLIACCDGLTGFPEAIDATWANATKQTCVVHLIRNSMKFVSYGGLWIHRVDLEEMVEDLSAAMAEQRLALIFIIDEMQDLDEALLTALLSTQHLAGQREWPFYIVGAAYPASPRF